MLELLNGSNKIKQLNSKPVKLREDQLNVICKCQKNSHFCSMYPTRSLALRSYDTSKVKGLG